jgi:HEAT repeat protein
VNSDPRALDALIELLESDELFVPQIAARALAKLGAAAERALHPLQELAERGNEVERRFALEAIARIKSDLEGRSDGEV